MPEKKPSWTEFTIMIPPPRPDADHGQERRQLRQLIEDEGVEAAIESIVDDYYQWQKDPHPPSAWRKRRATLIFSRAELTQLVPLEIHKLLQDFQFLLDNSKEAKRGRGRDR